MKHLPLFFCIVVLATTVCLPSQSFADVVISIAETPTGVAVEGSGTLDLEGLSVVFQGGQTVAINPTLSLVAVGGITPFADVIDSYGLSNGTLPPNIGPGIAFAIPNSVSGDNFGFGVFGGSEEIFVPTGYVSGNPLSGSSFYQGQSLASIGLTPGSYGFTIPSGDSVTLNISAIPEPNSAVLLCCGLCGSVLVIRRR